MGWFGNRLAHIGHSEEESLKMSQNKLITVCEGKDPNIDIVFLSGPNEQALAAWTTKDQKGCDVTWPKKFLRTDIPNARILAYSCQDSPAEDYKTDVSHLCEQLKEQRSRDTCQPLRPIVLVAHSLGGILAARVIEGDASISDHIRGLAFFATPFQGAGDSSLLDRLKSIRAHYKLPDKDLTQDIEALNALSGLLSTSRSSVKLASFSEDGDNGILVGGDAAKIPRVSRCEVIAITKNHDNICKFRTRGRWYQAVLEKIRELAEVKPISTAFAGMNNHGNVGNYIQGNVQGGSHNNNNGSIHYGSETNNYPQKP